MRARPHSTTPPDAPRGSLPPETGTMRSLPATMLNMSGSCSPVGDLGFLTLLIAADAVQCSYLERKRDLACHATSFCLRDRAWSSSGWADTDSFVDAVTRMEPVV